MFKEILKIIPTVDRSDLSRMESLLNSRFMKIGKKFGAGLKNVLMGGGVAGIALALIDKILNPLKEVQESIDRVLKQGDDLVTNANQFGTTAGKLFKLQQLGKATGLDEDALYTLISKFQATVAEAEADPKKQTSVRQFVGQEDAAAGFFEFIQALQKMDKNQQIRVQQEVFGEKQILKMADFLQSDFGKLSKQIGARSGDTYTPALEKLGGLNDLADALKAKQTLSDTLTKSKLINEDMITSKARADQAVLTQENERLKSYASIQTISEGTNKIFALLEKGFLMLTDLVTKVTNLTEYVKEFKGSKIVKGIFGAFGGGK